jgi:membrane protease YdiL (CAAX protease family)
MAAMPGASGLSRAQAWLDVVLAVALVGVAALVLGVFVQFFARDLRFPLLILLQGAVILTGLRLLLALRGERWSDVGLRGLRSKDLALALLAMATCFAANLVLTGAVFALHPGEVDEHLQLLEHIARQLGQGVPFPGVTAMMFFVGVYEELAARGFLLTRCRAALRGTWAPVLLSALLFGLGHVYQGWIGVAQTALIGVILAAFTVRWGTLWPAILAHAGLNTLSLLLMRHLALQVR